VDDVAVHDIDSILFVSQKKVVRLYAEIEKCTSNKYDDMLVCLLRMSDGAVGTLAINWLTPVKIRDFSIHSENGYFRVDYLTQNLVFYKNRNSHMSILKTESTLSGSGEGQKINCIVAKKEPLRAEQDAFISCILNNTDSPVSGEDSLKALRLTKAIIRSGTTHQIVDVDVGTTELHY
jgi:predicted dehydrogenase